MKPCSIRCMKFSLILFNIICILFGFILMAICVTNMREHKSLPDEQSSLSRGALFFLLTLGLCFINAVLGCFGALQEQSKILYVHACFYIFLVSVEVVIAVEGDVLSAWVGGASEMREPEQFYRNTTFHDEVSHRTYWDNLQSENQCCGADGPQDYHILSHEIPPSCCASAYGLEGSARKHLHTTCLYDQTYYAMGCEEALRQKMTLNENIFITIGIIFALLEIICIILALWMARTIRVEHQNLQQNPLTTF